MTSSGAERTEMDYLTSKRFELPSSRESMANGVWFNMWTIRLWPLRELEEGATLYFYETPNRRVVWKTRVTKIDTFQYHEKAAALGRLRREFGPFNPHQPYVEQAPAQGFCLDYAVAPLRRLSMPLPPGVRMSQQGWLRVTASSRNGSQTTKDENLGEDGKRSAPTLPTSTLLREAKETRLDFEGSLLPSGI